MRKRIASYANEDILHALRAARLRAGLSQRDLAARTGLPQSHISRIESGATDLRLSSLVELARTLGCELVLVPRRLLPAVHAITGDAAAGRPGDGAGHAPPDAPRPAYTLDGEDEDA